MLLTGSQLVDVTAKESVRMHNVLVSDQRSNAQLTAIQEIKHATMFLNIHQVKLKLT